MNLKRTQYTVRNIAKAAQYARAHYGCLTLKLRSGIDNTVVEYRTYRTIEGMLRNSGRKVRACFIVWSNGRPSDVMFEATY